MSNQIDSFVDPVQKRLCLGRAQTLWTLWSLAPPPQKKEIVINGILQEMIVLVHRERKEAERVDPRETTNAGFYCRQV